MAARRVLLLSPLPGLDPPNGDVTYTQHLLDEPPKGVEYITYDQALADGSLIELYRRASARLGLVGTGTFAREIAVNRLRRTDLMFSEPFRHFRVQERCFDVIHSHVFSIGLGETTTPLVVSNSVPIDALYLNGFGESPARVRVQRWLDRRLAASTGVSHSSFGQAGAVRVICFSAHLRDYFVRNGGDPRRYVVVPPSVQTTSRHSIRPLGRPPTLGFIGQFEAKGGQTVLDAYRMLRRQGLELSLTIVGSEPRLSAPELRDLDITWLPRLPRQVLLADIIPSFTVFAYPSLFDGLPLTLLEVMAAGVPTVVSDYGALPEVVDFGSAGRVVGRGDAVGLASYVKELLDSATAETVGRAGRKRVLEHYSPEANRENLGHVYADAVGIQRPIPLSRRAHSRR